MHRSAQSATLSFRVTVSKSNNDDGSDVSNGFFVKSEEQLVLKSLTKNVAQSVSWLQENAAALRRSAPQPPSQRRAGRGFAAEPS